jgi:two-component system, OmpR family, flagellar system response regulator FtcR
MQPDRHKRLLKKTSRGGRESNFCDTAGGDDHRSSGSLSFIATTTGIIEHLERNAHPFFSDSLRGREMILIVDERPDVIDGFTSFFSREGIPVSGVTPIDFSRWVESATDVERNSVDAVLVGNVESRLVFSRALRNRLKAAVIALNDQRSLDETLDLFAAGVDDVVRKPVHVREIMARVAAIQRRMRIIDQVPSHDDIRVFGDGRDPEVCGEILKLPRRERRILEFLVSRRGRRVTKTQIFNAVYGLFNDEIDENIVESHISKLRKRLKQQLGYDPINSQRYLGYCFEELQRDQREVA